MSQSELRAGIDRIALVDHHVHSVFEHEPTEAAFELALTEAALPPAPPARTFDSPLGFAVRGQCAEVLGLAPFVTPEEYLRARRVLGAEEVNRRFLRASGSARLVVDGGYATSGLLPEADLAALSGATVHPILRLETTAEDWITRTDQVSVTALRETLCAAARTAVGFKTIAAYRCGLALPAQPPDETEVQQALLRWADQIREQRQPARLLDPVIIRELIWWALVEGRRPLQVHTGLGDPDLRLDQADPLLLQPLLARATPTGTPVVLLHCYPFQRHAGYLASVFPHVYLDVGLSLNHAATASVRVVGESMELAPFGKILYSSDAYGLAELVYLGARQWRSATAAVLAENMDLHGWPLQECLRVADLIGHRTAATLYCLQDQQ